MTRRAPRRTPDRAPSARRDALELAALALLLFAVVWRVGEGAPAAVEPWLRGGLGLGIAVLVGVDLWRARADPASLGLATTRWREGWGTLLRATAAGVLGLAALGAVAGTASLEAARLEWLATYTLNLLGQQLLLQGVFTRRIYRLAHTRGAPRPERVAVLGATALFTALHAPNPALMLGVAIAALGWTAHFLHHRNLPALLLSHALLGATAMASLGPGPMLDLRVGRPAWERLRHEPGLRGATVETTPRADGAPAGADGWLAQVGGGEGVGVLVPARPGVGRDPHQLDPGVGAGERVELLH